MINRLEILILFKVLVWICKILTHFPQSDKAPVPCTQALTSPQLHHKQTIRHPSIQHDELTRFPLTSPAHKYTKIVGTEQIKAEYITRGEYALFHGSFMWGSISDSLNGRKITSRNLLLCQSPRSLVFTPTSQVPGASWNHTHCSQTCRTFAVHWILPLQFESILRFPRCFFCSLYLAFSPAA